MLNLEYLVLITATFLHFTAAEAEAALASNRTVKEKPDATETEKTKTAPSKDDKEPDIKPTDLICQSCVCKEKQVDCSNQDLDKFFTKSDWAGKIL